MGRRSGGPQRRRPSATPRSRCSWSCPWNREVLAKFFTRMPRRMTGGVVEMASENPRRAPWHTKRRWGVSKGRSRIGRGRRPDSRERPSKRSEEAGNGPAAKENAEEEASTGSGSGDEGRTEAAGEEDEEAAGGGGRRGRLVEEGARTGRGLRRVAEEEEDEERLSEPTPLASETSLVVLDHSNVFRREVQHRRRHEIKCERRPNELKIVAERSV